MCVHVCACVFLVVVRVKTKCTRLPVCENKAEHVQGLEARAWKFEVHNLAFVETKSTQQQVLRGTVDPSTGNWRENDLSVQ